MRADAQRNLNAILTAARESFAAGGLEVGVADIAKRAGVGTATVFRRFATKDDLICAVCEQSVAEMAERVAAAEAADDPWEGLRECMRAAIEMQVTDRGLCEALSRGIEAYPAVREAHDALVARLAVLVRRAQEEGHLRADLEPIDLPIVLNAVARAGAELEPIAPGAWRRYFQMLLDALRPGAPPLEVPAPTREQVDAAFAGEQGAR
ncbi:MAG TPA: helix-turn-helix domain-containing protein [Capillimicrobium sp.]|nr:helix-turn-helix domain-containing protein [Capillimicrobium sp.]